VYAFVVEETSVFHLTSATTDEHLPPEEKEKKEIQVIDESENFKGQPKAQGAAKYKQKILLDTAKMIKRQLM
jgi:hypothetical protein